MTVTNDEVLRVHRAECAANGHTYSEIEAYGVDGPVAIVCTHCGAQWKVERNEP